MRRKICLFMLCLVLVACSQSPTEESLPKSTATPPSTKISVIPSQTPEATAIPNSICLSIAGVKTEDLSEPIHQLLQALDFEVLENLDRCVAKLDIQMDGEALSENYQVNDSSEYRRCYSGAKYVGKIVFTAENQQEQIIDVNEAKIPPNYLSEICPEESSAPYQEAKIKTVLHGFMELFGDHTIVAAQNVDYFDEVSVLTELLAGGEYSETLIKEAIDLLDDPDPWVRYRAAQLVSFLRPTPQEIILPVFDQLKIEKSTDPDVRLRLLGILENAELTDKDILSQIILLLDNSPEGIVRRAAAVTIGKYGPGAKSATPSLVKALQDPGAGVRAAAAQALGSIHAPAEDSVEPLILLLSDTDSDVKNAAGQSLILITGIDTIDPQDAESWKAWWDTYLSSTPTPAPTSKPEAVIFLQAPEPFLSTWKQWDNRYVVYVHQSAEIQNFTDLDGKSWYAALMGADPEKFDIAGMVQDFNRLKDLSGLQTEVIFMGEEDFKNYSTGNTEGEDFYVTYFLDRPDFIGIMAPEVAKFYKFDQNEDLIRIDFK